MRGYTDLADLSEDDRIGKIGNFILQNPKKEDGSPIIVGVTVDDEGGTKAERYIKKLKEKFPSIRVIDRFKGPVANTETIRFGGPVQ